MLLLREFLFMAVVVSMIKAIWWDPDEDWNQDDDVATQPSVEHVETWAPRMLTWNQLSTRITGNQPSKKSERSTLITMSDACWTSYFFLISPQLVFLIMKINLVNGLEDHVRWIRKPVAIDKTKRHVRFLRKNGFFKRQIAVDRMKSGIESDLVSMVKHKCTH